MSTRSKARQFFYSSITIAIMFFLCALLLYVFAIGIARADSYVSIYGIGGHNVDPVTYETEWEKPSAAIALGLQSSGQVGALAELGFHNVGMFALIGGYLDVSGIKFNAGAIGIDDKSKTTVYGWSEDTSNEWGTGGFAGINFKGFSVRYIRYQATHNYSVRRQAGKTYEYMSVGPQDVKREQIWGGYTFNF